MEETDDQFMERVRNQYSSLIRNRVIEIRNEIDLHVARFQQPPQALFDELKSINKEKSDEEILEILAEKEVST